MDAESWGNRPNTKWKLQYEGKIIGTSETVTVANAVAVGKLLGRDSWLDCLPYLGPESCVAWLTVLTAPDDASGGMSTEDMLKLLQKILSIPLDELFNCLILE